MIPRRDLEKVLQNRLKGILPQQEFLELVTEIERLERDWEEMNLAHHEDGL